jgi:hypothetical protein
MPGRAALPGHEHAFLEEQAMAIEDLVNQLGAQTTRRTVIATGTKLVYAAPLVAATMKLSSHATLAISGGGGGTCENFVISGSGSDPNAAICVDDDVTISIVSGGAVVYDDADGVADCYPPSAPFAASTGDQLHIVATNTFCCDTYLEPLYLHCLDTGAVQQLNGEVNFPGAPEGVFYDEVFTITI